MKNLSVCCQFGKLLHKNALITFFALFFSVFSLYANDVQEKITLEFSNASLEEVFREIESSTDFNVFYENATFDLNKKVSLNVDNLELEKAMKLILDGTGITFTINKNQIILTPQETIAPTTNKVLQSSVKGNVVDENGVPLFGATIIIKGTSQGTTADMDGNFELTLPSNANTVVISYVGYKTQEVKIGSQTNLNVVMIADSADLEEIVVVGYGTSRKEDLTGAVSSVQMENIQSQAPTVSLDQSLQGQVPGVYIAGSNGQPGAPARIRIRGTTSLSGSNQPLYVIDGIPVVMESNIPLGGTQGQNLGDELDKQGLNTPIGNINANDIESISILKDASAAAIYGSRAANGVIIVTTKKGSFGGKPRFNADFSISTSEAKTLDVLNAQQFREVWTTAVQNGTINNAFTQSVLDGSYFGDADTNWEEEISPSSPVTQNANVSVQGGTENTRYYSALGATTQEGVFNGSAFDRYTFKLNLDSNLSSIWKYGVTSSISMTDQKAKDGGITERMYAFRPDLAVYDENGEYSFSPYYSFENPVALSDATNTNKTFLILSSIFTELELLKGLKAKTLLSINYNNGSQYSYYPKYTFRGGWRNNTGMGDGYAQESRSNYTNLMWENTLRYSNLFNYMHQVDAVVGASFEQNQNSQVMAWGEGFFNDVLTNVSSATVDREGSSTKSGSGLASYFGRMNYNYDSRYLLSLSARVDGSSKFATENKYAFFPAMAAGWRISEETFLKDFENLNELKLRASWGITGQQDFGPYQWRTLYEADDYGNQPSIMLSQLGNDKLKWEKSKQTDFGIDFSFFDDRISGGIGYYQKITEDAIFPAITPGNTGFSRVLANVGNTKNTGYELELSGDLIRNEDFNWRLSFNASANKNELTRISDDFKDEDGYVVGFGGGGRLREGSPIGLIYGYVFEKIIQTPEEIEALNAASPTGYYQRPGTAPGDLMFRDLSGPDGEPDGVVNTFDQQVIGNTQPDFFGGFSNSFRYKGLSLTAQFTYAFGNDLEWFQQSRSINVASTYVGENKTTEVLDAWTPESPTGQPRLVYGDPNQNARASSYYVHDASYVRLKSLNLAYNFSQEFMDKWNFLNSASVYVIGQNLLTFTDYPGADPEASNLYNNDISAGRDNNRFPVSKVLTAGIKIGF